MSNENDKRFFYKLAKNAKVNPNDVIKLVWGKFSKDRFWYGNESKTISGNNIWQARTAAIHKGLNDKLLKPKKR